MNEEDQDFLKDLEKHDTVIFLIMLFVSLLQILICEL